MPDQFDDITKWSGRVVAIVACASAVAGAVFTGVVSMIVLDNKLNKLTELESKSVNGVTTGGNTLKLRLRHNDPTGAQCPIGYVIRTVRIGDTEGDFGFVDCTELKAVSAK